MCVLISAGLSRECEELGLKSAPEPYYAVGNDEKKQF